MKVTELKRTLTEKERTLDAEDDFVSVTTSPASSGRGTELNDRPRFIIVDEKSALI